MKSANADFPGSALEGNVIEMTGSSDQGGRFAGRDRLETALRAVIGP